MADPALTITGLRASIDPEAGARRELRLRVEAGVVGLSADGLAALAPPDLEFEGIRGDRLIVRWKAFTAEVLLEGTPAGTLCLRCTALRAGFLPVPAEALGLALGFLAKQEGIRAVDGRTFDVDLQRLARRIRIELPPLERVVVEPEGVTLRFSQS